MNIPNYKVLKEIGAGGMGTVYLAEHTLIKRKVAIKSLKQDLIKNEQLRERFKKEATALAQLEHPNIVRLNEYIEQQDGVFLIMEYVDGLPLDEHINNVSGPINEEQLMPLFLQILDAFEYAHKNKIVHRDIKPSNFIITKDGKIKVLDFGIAKIMDETNSMTKTGTQMGSVLYMSPEQVRGEKVNHLSDIYSLGVTLFQMTTGKAPYDPTTNEYQVFQKIDKEPLPTASSIYPGISKKLEEIIEKATNKNSSNRFQSCKDFKKDIEKLNYKEVPEKVKEINEPTKTETIEKEKTIIMNESQNINKNNRKYKITISVIGTLLLGSVLFNLFFSSNNNIDSFIIVNSKLENTIRQVEAFNANISWTFDTKLATLRATGAPADELARVKSHKNSNDSIVLITRNVCNELIKRNLFILIRAVDASTTFDEFERIEEVVTGYNQDAAIRLMKLSEKINKFKINSTGESTLTKNDFENDLFEIDDEGYIHIKNLSNYSKNGNFSKEFDLIHILKEYRNNLIALISNHDSETPDGGIVYNYKFDPTLIKNPDYLDTDLDYDKFENNVDSTISLMINNLQLDPADAEAIRNIWVRLTIPKKSRINNKDKTWVAAQFNEKSILSATVILSTLRSDILQAQTLASQLVSSRVKVQSFNFNKIEPIAYASTSYLNQGDSLNLRVMIAAYDSSDAMELKYWLDDTSQLYKYESEQDLANMQTFKGKAGQKVSITAPVGDHILSGFIAIKEKGLKKWKPWQFKFSVGSSSDSENEYDK